MFGRDPDFGLVDGMVARDACVMQLLVSRKYHRLACFLTAMMPGDTHGAEALAVKALRCARDMIDSFDQLDIRFDTWLHKLALNLWRNEGRSVRLATAEPQGVMAALDETTRICVILSVFQGLAPREIARILSVSADAVEKRLIAARRKIQATQGQRTEPTHAA